MGGFGLRNNALRAVLNGVNDLAWFKWLNFLNLLLFILPHLLYEFCFVISHGTCWHCLPPLDFVDQVPSGPGGGQGHRDGHEGHGNGGQCQDENQCHDDGDDH